MNMKYVMWGIKLESLLYPTVCSLRVDFIDL